ncbi:MAG TPA: HAMP domain-containing sensor histidine kinase [Gemmatimonadaceae bacterium]|nr:HAMP domain-containing sensor histidine kinase [Gemmatimonadaceae bacterium]
MTLRARLALGLAIIALVLVTPLVVARTAIHRLHDEVRKLQTTEFRASLKLGRLRDAFADVRARELALTLVRNDTVYVQLVDAIAHAQALADTLVELPLESRAGIAPDSSAALISRALRAMPPVAKQEIDAYRAGRDSADSISQTFMHPVMQQTESALSHLEQILRELTGRRVDEAERQLQESEDVSIVALLVGVALSAAVALWLTRSISRPVEALETGMRAVAEGDLDHRLDLSPERRDEFGRLAVSFQTMSRQLIELDKLKAEFVSVASHELKTPINVILGYLQLMQDGIYGPLSSKQTEVLSTVESQGRTLARLAAHLLDVTRFEAGGGRIDPRPVRLSTVLEDLERAFHVLAVQRGIDFRVTLTPGLPAEVQWDVDRMNEVMGNLLANAFKFTGAGGTVELIAMPNDDRVRIEVRDTGAGIPPAQLPHIFEKFYQADNQRAASATGSGLGLAIAKEIVEAHRGEIRCDSTLGEGTTFTLLMPATVGRRRTGSYRTIEYEVAS